MTQRSFPIVGQNLSDADWRSIFGRRFGIVGDGPDCYRLTRVADTDLIEIGSTEVVSRAVVAGFGHLIGDAQTENITVPVAANPTIGRTDLLVLRYDPQHSGAPGPVRLHRIPGVDGQAAAPAHNPDTDLPLWAVRRLANQPIQLATVTDMRQWDAQTSARPDGTLQLRVAGELTTPLPAGMIIPFAGENAPAGWLECRGQTVERAAFPRLFAAIGTAYGPGNGTTTFTLPNLVGRFPLGAGTSGTAGAVNRGLGQAGGTETVTLTTAQMPSHTHTQASHTHTSAAHTHSINHDHAAVTTSSNGAHTHTIDHGHGQATTSSSGAHTHGAGTGSGFQVTRVGANPAGGGSTIVAGSAGTVHTHVHNAGMSSAGAHTHTVTVPGHTGNSGSAGAHTHTVDLPNFTGTSGSTTPGPTGAATPVIYATGGGEAHPNMPPFLTLNYLIKT